MHRRGRGAAAHLLGVIEPFLGCSVPVRVRAWDGSTAGSTDPTAPVVVVRRRRALRHLVWSPGELGLARAYVTGDLDVEGDLAEGLRRVWDVLRDNGRVTRPGSRQLAAAATTLARLGAVGPRPKRPVAESLLSGRLHTRRRDRAAISHHYDLSNDFYRLILDPAHLAYSCAYYTHDDPAYPLVDAQRDKLDLVCRKLGLREGDRLLDIGCGWGSLSLHAAREYGAHVTGVTLSGAQRDHVEKVASAEGLDDRVAVRLQHFADLDERGMDAVASLEMGEHVGEDEYAGFADTIFSSLRPGGRALIQQMSRGDVAPGGGAFIETYIAPDMHMKPLHTTLRLLTAPGLEVRHVEAMREHYPRTVAAWARTLEDNWQRAVDLVGEQTARVWRLYLAGGALAFEQNRMGVDQILLVRATEDGRSLMPWTPAGWLPVGEQA